MLFWLGSLFTAEEAAAVVELLADAPRTFSTAPDSTDLQPAFEATLLNRGRVIDDDDDSSLSAAGASAAAVARKAWLEHAIGDRVRRCVTPFVREKFRCPKCVPCVSIARRYRQGERLQVSPHRDVQSLVTMTVELQHAQPAPESGGLYLMSGDSGIPNYPFLRAGDAFLHNYELLHGVKVSCGNAMKGLELQQCTRYSLVVWFQEDEAKCVAGGEIEQAEAMLRRSADAGVAEGRYRWALYVLSPLLANASSKGTEDMVEDDDSDSGDDDDEPAKESAAAAAASGTTPVVVPEYVKRRGGLEQVVADAVSFLEAAATEQAHAGAALFLFDLLVDGCQGCGLAAADAYVAEEWLDRARTLGHAEATAPTRSAKIEAARKMQGKAKMNWFGKWMEKKRRNRKERTEYESNMRTFWFGILLFLIWNFPNPCLAPPKKEQGERSSSGGDGGAQSKKKDRRKSKAHKRHEKTTNKKKKKL